jgi:hypothetical protein
MERYGASQELWKWIDAHENELGIGRPYLDRDPPHVGPIDGKEYTDKRHRPKVQIAGLKTKNVPKAKAGLKTKNAPMAKAAIKKPQLAVRNDPAAVKRIKPAKPPKVSGLQASAIAQR